MPASAKRKAERRLKFGKPQLEQANNNAPSLARPEFPPETDSDIDSEDDGDGGVPIQTTDLPFQEPFSPDPSGSPETPAPASTTPKDSKDLKTRYILFVGNLPFDATTAGVERHFASVRPTQVRHRTDKATGKSRGFAFVEFDSHARMDACLTRYHRSEYREGQEARDETATETEMREDGQSTANGGVKMEGPKGARRINVQLTAGGGGKSETRRKRLQQKNEKLDRERHKRLKKARNKKEDRHKAKKTDGKEAAADPQDSFEAEEGMHPSRRARFARK